MPDPKITRKVFEHLVDLAALSLQEGEAEYLQAELNDQLSAIRDLEQIDVPADLPITSHGVNYGQEISHPLREDAVHTSDAAGAILEGAPHTEEGYIIVPDIPTEDLE